MKIFGVNIRRNWFHFISHLLWNSNKLCHWQR